MGKEPSLGAVEDNVSPLHIAGYDALHRDELSLADAGIHASPTGPETHSGALAQQFSGEIQK